MKRLFQQLIVFLEGIVAESVSCSCTPESYLKTNISKWNEYGLLIREITSKYMSLPNQLTKNVYLNWAKAFDTFPVETTQGHLNEDLVQEFSQKLCYVSSIRLLVSSLRTNNPIGIIKENFETIIFGKRIDLLKTVTTRDEIKYEDEGFPDEHKPIVTGHPYRNTILNVSINQPVNQKDENDEDMMIEDLLSDTTSSHNPETKNDMALNYRTYIEILPPEVLLRVVSKANHVKRPKLELLLKVLPPFVVLSRELRDWDASGCLGPEDYQLVDYKIRMNGFDTTWFGDSQKFLALGESAKKIVGNYFSSHSEEFTSQCHYIKAANQHKLNKHKAKSKK